MAINPSTNATMAGRITAADGNYPYGSSKDETAPAAGDGTPYFKARADDIFGFQQALLKAAGIVPSGNADNVNNSQYMQCLVEMISGRAINYDETGAADAYVLEAQTDQYEPDSLFDGLYAQAFAGNANTGASTVNVAGLGVINIKLRGGTLDPEANDIRAGELMRLVYRTSPSAHFELIRAGKVKRTVVTASDPSWAPSPDASIVEFTAIGGGGGAGGTDGQGASTASIARAGSGGGYAIKLVKNPSGTYNITVGAGGAGGASGSNNGANGGNTTVVGTGVNINAGGGRFGSGHIGTNGNSSNSAVEGGVSTGGDINGKGTASGIRAVIGGVIASAPVSGFCPIMGGGVEALVDASANGKSATIPGEGGGAIAEEGTTANRAGGDGFRGEVQILEFLG